MKKQFLPVAALLLVAALAGCVRDPLNDMTEEESRIYITNYDTSVNYSAYSTFSIADSVAIVQNNRLLGYQRNENDAQFIAAVATALQQRGFTRVNSSQNPDLAVSITRVNNTQTGLVSYTDYNGYYGGYWDPYWGSSWGGYDYYFPTYYGVYQVNESALTIDIFDLKNRQQNNAIRSVWSGLIRGSGIFRTQNVSTQVMALFDQSPYLKAQ